MSERPCAVCRVGEPRVGALCEPCSDDIVAPAGLLPQQIVGLAGRPTHDALLDQWGRAHPLEDRTLIGRSLESPGILILDASVSRHYAHIARDKLGWRIRDLASANGTFVNDAPIDIARLAHGDRVAIGSARFYLASDVGRAAMLAIDPATIATVRTHADLATPALVGVDDETTDAGLPTVDLRVLEAPSGGALQLGTVTVTLSANQVRLIAVLAQRMAAEAAQPGFVRGFVRSSELLGTLPWDSADPDDNHVKQLVRRTRRQLVRGGLGDLIEARQRFGYRLRVIPREDVPK